MYRFIKIAHHYVIKISPRKFRGHILHLFVDGSTELNNSLVINGIRKGFDSCRSTSIRIIHTPKSFIKISMTVLFRKIKIKIAQQKGTPFHHFSSLSTHFLTHTLAHTHFDCLFLFLDEEINVVLLAPLDLGPNTLVDEHEGRLEDGITAGNLGGDAEVLGNEQTGREGVADGEEAPDEGLGQGPAGIVGAGLAAGLTLVHEALADEHGGGLGEEVGPDDGEGDLDAAGEFEGGDEGDAAGDDAPHEGLDGRAGGGFGEVGALGDLAQGQTVEVVVLLLLEGGRYVVELVDLLEVLLLLAVGLLDLLLDGEGGLLVALGQFVDVGRGRRGDEEGGEGRRSADTGRLQCDIGIHVRDTDCRRSSRGDAESRNGNEGEGGKGYEAALSGHVCCVVCISGWPRKAK